MQQDCLRLRGILQLYFCPFAVDIFGNRSIEWLIVIQLPIIGRQDSCCQLHIVFTTCASLPAESTFDTAMQIPACSLRISKLAMLLFKLKMRIDKVVQLIYVYF